MLFIEFSTFSPKKRIHYFSKTFNTYFHRHSCTRFMYMFKKMFLYIHSSIHSFICKHMLKFLFIYFVILFFLNMQPQTPTFHVNSIYPSGLKFSLYFHIIYKDFFILNILGILSYVILNFVFSIF